MKNYLIILSLTLASLSVCSFAQTYKEEITFENSTAVNLYLTDYEGSQGFSYDFMPTILDHLKIDQNFAAQEIFKINKPISDAWSGKMVFTSHDGTIKITINYNGYDGIYTSNHSPNPMTCVGVGIRCQAVGSWDEPKLIQVYN